MGCGWTVPLYLSCSTSIGSLKTVSLKDSNWSTLGLSLGLKYLSTLGLSWSHIAIGDGRLVYVPTHRSRTLWPHTRYVRRCGQHLVTTLWVPCPRPLDLAQLASPWDSGCYARRVITGHDCFAVACRGLSLAGHDVSRWRGPVALFEYLNGLEGLRHDDHTQTHRPPA